MLEMAMEFLQSEQCSSEKITFEAGYMHLLIFFIITNQERFGFMPRTLLLEGCTFMTATHQAQHTHTDLTQLVSRP